MELAALQTRPSTAAVAAFSPANSSSSSLSTLRRNPLTYFPTTSSAITFPKPQSVQFSPSKIIPQISTNPPSSSSKCIKTRAAADGLSPPETTLKARLRNGETLYGIFLLSFSPTLAEIAGLSGYDFAVVDMEHGPGGISEALHCLRALAATNTAAILRIPESSATWAKKALDLGPQGIMFPMIDTAEDARKAVSFCRFPPNGIRGSAHTVVRASGYGLDQGYLSNYEDELLILCQVESEKAVKNIKEIAAVEGVDCIQMGPLDLSASLGYLWDPGHKKVKDVLRAAEREILEDQDEDGGGRKAYLSGFAMPHDRAVDLKARGYHMVSGPVDVGLFRNAAVEDVNTFRMGLNGSSSDDHSDEEGDGKEDDDDKYWSE
ncbi:OLC1v1028892C1 [Oldenlandia corymbosa var. corymbosa]|uniref:OLC1v1028892C1 n=1 Tax=Oldenlandia corymbosa var. corymbosa TaxID=529605 RepID=A0AAV1CCR9_OLDCO|nr:OLC1v1028892C1 [Oldenlandia corymbosa var. corymbosa]